MALEVGPTRREGTGTHQLFATARILLQTRGKPSVHVEMRRKREIYLLVLGNTTRSSPEATQARRACADTRMAVWMARIRFSNP